MSDDQYNGIVVTIDSTLQEYDNPSFELEEEGATSAKFAEVVDHILRQPCVSDIHPYGRGNLYGSLFNKRDLDDHTDSGKLISWVVVVILLVGFAGGIVMLAISTDSEHVVDMPALMNDTMIS